MRQRWTKRHLGHVKDRTTSTADTSVELVVEVALDPIVTDLLEHEVFELVRK